MKKYFLFDLDGTLTDPKLGICTCVQYALKDQGIEVNNLDVLEPFIGPPLKDSFMHFYGMNEENAEKAIAKYRERFSEIGLFENEVYEGIPQMLRGLKTKGFKLAVASSKPQVFVERILEHFSLKQYFDAVVGSELDGTRVNKDEVVQEALRQLFGEDPVNPEQIYMIGDRCFDVEGARAFGIESVGVTYGYGGLEELMESKADYIVQSVPELYEFLLREEPVVSQKLSLPLIWQLIYPFILFALAQGVAANVHLLGLRGNISGIISVIAYLIAGFFIWKAVQLRLVKAKADMWLSHIRGDKPITYAFAVVGMVSAVLGMNVLLEVLGITQKARIYEALQADPNAVGFYVRILAVGICLPIVEELLFRGVLYDFLKGFTKRFVAMVVSAFIFGLYRLSHGELLLALVLGWIFVYTYEYFGSFAFPVAFHIFAGILTCVISYTVLAVGPLYCMPVGIVCVVISIVCFVMMEYKKTHVKGASGE